MEKIFRQEINMWSLSCDNEHVLHDIRNSEVSKLHHATVKVSDLDYWEELPADAVSPYTKIEYDNKVAELVRERYSESEEFAIQRKAINAAFSPSVANAESALSEYQEYNDFVEECKQAAKNPLLYKSEVK